MGQSYDDVVIGAGILGLAHAYHLASRGRKVVVFERNARACGASVRNFGMLWPIGQPLGPLHQMAKQSLSTWHHILKQTDLWHAQVGSLHVAYHEDELQVLREFTEIASAQGCDVELLSAKAIANKSPSIQQQGLLGGLFSPIETCVDPRQVIVELPAWLNSTYGVEFRFGHLVTHCQSGRVIAHGQSWNAERIWICSGEDLQTLYPEVLTALGLRRCKLQMLRTEPGIETFQLGPMLAGGLTLRHYQNFADCPTVTALRQRIASETPEYDQFGIHVMASQNGRGEVTIGDSHEYDQQEQEPFNREKIDRLILDYLGTLLDISTLRIAERWHGIYVKHSEEPYVVKQPEEGVTLITGIGGNGMTLSFGLAEQVVHQIINENKYEYPISSV